MGSKNSPKVCFASSYYTTLGGIAKSAKRITNFLRDEGFDVYVITSGHREADVISYDKQGIPVPVLYEDIKVYTIPIHDHKDDPSLDNYIWMKAFYDMIKRLDQMFAFDIFHGFYCPIAYPCILVADGTRPVIASIRGNEVEKWALQPWGLPFIHLVLEKASWITTVGRDLLKVGRALSDISYRSTFIPNSIASACNSQWTLTEGNRGVVGTVGRFADFKDIPTLIEAYARISPDLRNRLLLVGDFPYKTDRIKSVQTISEYHLESQTYITGYIKNKTELSELRKSMRVFVLSSKIDGMPNALLEAASEGVPIVSTSTGGLKDILQDGQNALLVPPQNPEGLAKAIEHVLRSDTTAERLSRGAKQLAGMLSSQKEKIAWLELYQNLLG